MISFEVFLRVRNIDRCNVIEFVFCCCPKTLDILTKHRWQPWLMGLEVGACSNDDVEHGNETFTCFVTRIIVKFLFLTFTTLPISN